MRQFIFLTIFGLFNHFAFGQRICEGILLDSLTRQPIEFANIGIVGKGVGTVTDEKGRFNFKIPDSLSTLPVKISMLGYKTKNVFLNTLEKQSSVLLPPQAVSLQEVSVAAKKLKIKVLGNDTKTKSVSAGFKKNNLGAELGIRLNIKHPQTQLRKFMVNILANSLGKPPVFRINLYSVGKDGYPYENILKQNIIIEPTEMKGFIEVDLRPYAIFVNDDVFISIEWIRDLGDATGLYFSTKLVGNSTYFRQASQDKWEKIPSIGVGLHVEAAY
jgi:hypothetical protein